MPDEVEIIEERTADRLKQSVADFLQGVSRDKIVSISCSATGMSKASGVWQSAMVVLWEND